MKPVQIVLLVIAGALGGAVLTKTVWLKPKPAAPTVAEVQPAAPQPASPAPAVQPPATAPVEPEPVKAEPVKVEPVRPSPIPARRDIPKPQRAAKMPPPANPRSIETARVEPPPPPVQSQPQPAQAASPPAPEPAVSTPPARPEPEHATPPPPPPAPNRVTLNAGVLLPVRLIDGLSTERNQPADTFTGTLDKELTADGFVIAERGARVEGRVVNVDRGGKTRGVAQMTIELTRIHTSDGQTVAIQTDSFERRAESSRNTDAAKVGGGAVIGAIIGAIAGGGKGAAIGAGVGGGAGAGDVLLTRGKPVTFPSEMRLSFRLHAPVTITERN